MNIETVKQREYRQRLVAAGLTTRLTPFKNAWKGRAPVKDYWSKEKRAAYMREYHAKRGHYKHNSNKEFIGPPTPNLCDCGRDFGMILRGTEWICHRCKATEGIDWHSNQINEDLAIARAISPAWLLRQLQAWQEGIKTWIDDRGSELVVHGHGEYHLQLTP